MYLFIIFKGLSFKQIKPTFLEGDSQTLMLKCIFDLAWVSSGLIMLGCWIVWWMMGIGLKLNVSFGCGPCVTRPVKTLEKRGFYIWIGSLL